MSKRSFLAALIATTLVFLIILVVALPGSPLSAASVSGVGARWTFDEGTGTDFADVSGNGNDGTLVEGDGYPQWVEGKQGPYALSFNPMGAGKDTDEQYATTTYELLAPPSVTVAAWVKTEFNKRETSMAPIIRVPVDAKDSGGRPRSFVLGLGQSALDDWGCVEGVGEAKTGQVLFMEDRQLCGVCSNIEVNDDQWHHIVGVWNPGSATNFAKSQFEIYVDGVLDYHTDFKQDRPCNNVISWDGTSNGPATIAFHQLWHDMHSAAGRNNTNTEVYFPGSVDDVQIYKSALTAEDVKTLYVGKLSISGNASGETNIPETFVADVGATEGVTYTYQWEATDQLTQTHKNGNSDSATFSWPTTGTKHITVSAWIDNPSKAITSAHTIEIKAVPIADVVLTATHTAAYSESYDFIANTYPFHVTTPLTYSWHATGSVSPTNSITLTDKVSDTVRYTWVPTTPLVSPFITSTVTYTVENAVSIVTRTRVVSITHRPVLSTLTDTLTSTIAIRDEDTGRLALTIYEDEETNPIRFSVVDTDTIGYIALSGTSSNTMLVPNEHAHLGTSTPISDGIKIYTSTMVITPTANRWGESHITLRADDELIRGLDDFWLLVEPVNDQPSFVMPTEVTVTEDSGAHTEAPWLRDIYPGPYEAQKISISSENSHAMYFAEQPTLGITDTDATSFGLSGSTTDTLTATLRFTPAPNANGTAVVTVTVEDDGGVDHGGVDTMTRTFTINITPVNDQPQAFDNTLTTPEDTPLTIMSSELVTDDVDIDGDMLSVSAVQEGQHGTARIVTDTIIYTPSPNFHGTDVITYTASDGDLTDTALLTITVTPVNDAPVANNDTIEVLEDTQTTIQASEVLTNDHDLDGDTLQVASVSTTSREGGMVGVVGSTIVYSPTKDFFGVDTFTYAASDVVATNSLSSTAIVTVTVKPVNDAPSFTKGPDQSVRSEEGGKTVVGWATGISVGPSNEAEQSLTFLLTNNMPGLFLAQPTLTITDTDPTSGTLSFTPQPTADGTATVLVQLRDDGGTENGGVDTSATQTFTIEMNGNDAPVAAQDNFTTEKNVALPITETALLQNDTDPNGDTVSLVAVEKNSTEGGTVAHADDGTITYTPPTDFVGTDAFSYTISDGRGVNQHAVGTAAVEVTKPSEYRTFLPLILQMLEQTGEPDLTGTFFLSPNKTTFDAGEQVVITAVITNAGTQETDPFWVDLFLNPSKVPEAGDTWQYTCAITPCYGLAWGVQEPIAPGTQIELTSDANGKNSFNAAESNWEGKFASGTTDLYLYIDNVNEEGSQGQSGAVMESNEDNNRVHRQITVTGSTPIQVIRPRFIPPPPSNR